MSHFEIRRPQLLTLSGSITMSVPGDSSNNLIAPVLTRAVVGHYRDGALTIQANALAFGGVSDAVPSQSFDISRMFPKPLETPSQDVATATRDAVQRPRRARAYFNSPRRREQCRINQKRYREKLRTTELDLTQSIENLQQEILRFKRRRLEVGKSTRSPWSVVNDVFRLMEIKFRPPLREKNKKDKLELRCIASNLETSFASDVQMGEFTGTDKMVEQLRRYSKFFFNPQIRLEAVENAAPGVMVASAVLSVTVSKLTLSSLFSPHHPKVFQSKYDARSSPQDHLVGQRLDCDCSITFFFDSESDRVVRVETSVDWMSPLHRILGSLEETAKVLEAALMSREGFIG